MPIETKICSKYDLQSAHTQLSEQGYVVLEGILKESELEKYREVVEDLLTRERETPYEPDDGPAHPDDVEIEAFYAKNYTISKTELARVMKRVRHTRAQNYDTPWPVHIKQVMKLFIHLPLFFDEDKSQRVMNLPSKSDLFGRLIENQIVLELVRGVLDNDCILSDLSVNSIGPQAKEGGAWHVDVPLGQLEEPLPHFPLTVQNVWMLDDFTEDNGATHVVPRSHLRRKRPVWGEALGEEDVILTAPAGSVAIWLSNTWHRSGSNATDKLRRAILGYYCRSWVKPFTDFRPSIPKEMAERFSPTLRYLLGFSSNPPTFRS